MFWSCNNFLLSSVRNDRKYFQPLNTLSFFPCSSSTIEIFSTLTMENNKAKIMKSSHAAGARLVRNTSLPKQNKRERNGKKYIKRKLFCFSIIHSTKGYATCLSFIREIFRSTWKTCGSGAGIGIFYAIFSLFYVLLQYFEKYK